MTNLLLASARDEDRPCLEGILDATRWRVVAVNDVTEAAAEMKRGDFPVVLCDRDLASGNWPQSLRTLLAACKKVCVILISNVTDEYLWTEVVHNGGFDVLTRPFRKEQVTAMVEFAFNYWKAA
jgi:DNA-binding NtrC family response regulator